MIKRAKSWQWLWLWIGLSLSGCSSLPTTDTSPDANTDVNEAVRPHQGEIAQQWNATTLNAFYQQWQGTPYRLGGLDKRGTDCSGFVYMAYKTLIGGDIARTVDGQALLGKRIPKSALRTGDLVFLKPRPAGGMWVFTGKIISLCMCRVHVG